MKNCNINKIIWRIISAIWGFIYIVGLFTNTNFEQGTTALIWFGISSILALGEEILEKVDKKDENGKEY